MHEKWKFPFKHHISLWVIFAFTFMAKIFNTFWILKSVNAQQNMFSNHSDIQFETIPIQTNFGLKSYPNTITKNIRFWVSHPNAIGIRILVFGLKYSKNIWILNYSLNSVWGKLRLSGASWVINDSWGWNHLTMLRMSDTK